MTTVTAANNTSADIYTSLHTGGSARNSYSATAATDKFLKMLVAQMQNQDPLNPMDNAQVTSQMAQINTVSGLEQVNTSVLSLNSQLLQMQALQGATLVNRPVTLAGNQLSVEAVVKKIADEHGARVDISNRVSDGVVCGAQVSLSFAMDITPAA